MLEPRWLLLATLAAVAAGIWIAVMVYQGVGG